MPAAPARRRSDHTPKAADPSNRIPHTRGLKITVSVTDFHVNVKPSFTKSRTVRVSAGATHRPRPRASTPARHQQLHE
jgi:hypothetical protein